LTRKDYVRIAEAIRKVRASGPFTPRRDRETIDAVVLNLAEAFSEDNPRFDFARFVDATEAK
jgi:hypothetical protein